MSSPTELFGQASRAVRTLPIMGVGIALVYSTQLIPGQMALPAGVTGLFIIGMAVAAELFSYLQRGRAVYNVSYEGIVAPQTDRIEVIEQEITRFKDQLAASEQDFAERIFSQSDKEDLKRTILDRLPQLEVKEALFEFTQKIGDQQQQATLAGLRQLYEGIIGSLDRQIIDLGRRANLNLVMGSSITIVGLIVLSYFVFYAVHPPSADVTEVAVYFGTRLTLVVFIEVFAYFFLRLYRYSLFEIKYFQNEITNARFKIVALEACSREDSRTTLDKICMELVKTERNFVLKKGESTLSLRRDEIEQMSDSSVAKIFERILSSRESTKTDTGKTI